MANFGVLALQLKFAWFWFLIALKLSYQFTIYPLHRQPSIENKTKDFHRCSYDICNLLIESHRIEIIYIVNGFLNAFAHVSMVLRIELLSTAKLVGSQCNVYTGIPNASNIFSLFRLTHSLCRCTFDKWTAFSRCTKRKRRLNGRLTIDFCCMHNANCYPSVHNVRLLFFQALCVCAIQWYHAHNKSSLIPAAQPIFRRYFACGRLKSKTTRKNQTLFIHYKHLDCVRRIVILRICGMFFSGTFDYFFCIFFLSWSNESVWPKRTFKMIQLN